jgi:hypothetical protein
MEDRKEVSPQVGESRRDAVKKMAYAAPFVLSLVASPAFARSGSGESSMKGSSGARPSKSYKTNTK